MNSPEQQHSPIDPLELAAERFENKLNTAAAFAQGEPAYDLYVQESEGDVDVRTTIVRLWNPAVKLRERDFFVLRETTAYGPQESSSEMSPLRRHEYTLAPLSAGAYNQKGYEQHFPVARITTDVDSAGGTHTSFYAAEVALSKDGTNTQEVRSHDAETLAQLAAALHPVNPGELKQRAVKKIPREALRAKQQIAEDVDVMALFEQQAASPNAAVAARLGASAVHGE